MKQAEHSRGPARLQLVLIAVLFFGPLLVAAWMYYGGNLKPATRSNHGILLEPIRPFAGAHPELRELAPGQWLLVYADDSPCEEPCRESLYTLRQSRLMLGNDMNRLTRLYLRGEKAPDSSFLDEQHSGLKTAHNTSLTRDLWLALPQADQHGGYFLIDPLGNLVMYFPPDLSPREMVEDIGHLLDLSQIG
jgi:hypothetical protein